MKIYTIDFITPIEGSRALDIEGNYVNLDSISVFSKEPFEYDIDARVVIQTEFDLDSMENTNRIADIVDTIVRKTFENYFSSKINKYIFDNLQTVQKELEELLQLELVEYSFKIERFVISRIERGMKNRKNVVDKKFPADHREEIPEVETCTGIEQLDVYKAVVDHRNYCPRYRSGRLCLDCFGGGLTKFTSDLLSEMKKKDIKIEDLVQEEQK
jgi:hypothetical protein